MDATSSRGMEGVSPEICSNWSRAERASASIFQPGLDRFRDHLDAGLEIWFVSTNSTTRKRTRPCTSRRMVLSGARNSRWTVAIVPM